MDRIQHITKQTDKFGVGKHGFKDGDPPNGIAATVPGAISFDSYQEEIMAVIEAAGLTPDSGDYTQLLQALQILAGGLQKGTILGRLEYVSTTQARLARAYEQALRVEIDGKLLSSTDITWDITSGGILDTGSEASSTWYYLYLVNVGGVLTPRMSATPPVRDAASGKVSYHPTQVGWRYVGAVYNDSGSNFVRFRQEGQGRFLLPFSSSAEFSSTTNPGGTLVAASPPSWIPLTARAYQFNIRVTCGQDVGLTYEVAINPDAGGNVAHFQMIEDTFESGGDTHQNTRVNLWAPVHNGVFYHRLVGTIGSGGTPFAIYRTGYFDPFGV